MATHTTYGCRNCGTTPADHGPENSCPTPPGAPPSWRAQRYDADPGQPVDVQAPVARRLVIDLNDRSRSDLAAMCELEGLNKTTVTNRAVQLYRRVREAQERDAVLTLQHADGTTERLVIL